MWRDVIEDLALAEERAEKAEAERDEQKARADVLLTRCDFLIGAFDEADAERDDLRRQVKEYADAYTELDEDEADLRRKLAETKAAMIRTREEYHAINAEVRERERAAYYEGWITGCVSPAMTQEQIRATAMRRYKEA
jgi:chromosome segregation ATPase